MFLKLKYLFLFLIISIVINSCRKKECWETGECTPIHYDFNLDSIKDYFHAEKGSYWIYLNTKTNELDTHICTGYLLDTIHHRGADEFSTHITITYERLFRSDFITSLNRTISIETNPLYAESFRDTNKLRRAKTYLKRHVIGASTECFFFRFDPNAVAGYGGYELRFKGIEPSMDIQGNTYQNVVKFELNRDPTWRWEFNDIKNRIVTYYWVKNVGLIKREAEGYGGNIELVDYNIIK